MSLLDLMTSDKSSTAAPLSFNSMYILAKSNKCKISPSSSTSHACMLGKISDKEFFTFLKFSFFLLSLRITSSEETAWVKSD